VCAGSLTLLWLYSGGAVPNLALAREQGAIAAVLKAMEIHPENEALQAEGCWALLVFCSNTGTSDVLAF